MVSMKVKAPSVEGGPGLEAALGIVDVALPAAEGANLPVMPAPGPTVPQPFSEAGPTDTTDGATLPTACAKPVAAATQAAAEAAPLTRGRKRSAEATKVIRRQLQTLPLLHLKSWHHSDDLLQPISRRHSQFFHKRRSLPCTHPHVSFNLEMPCLYGAL